MSFSVAPVKFHWSGINLQVLYQSECRNCCLYIIIQKIAPLAESRNYFQIWFSPFWGGENGGVLGMRMQVILDSLFARPGSAPIGGGKKREFRDWTTSQTWFIDPQQGHEYTPFCTVCWCLPFWGITPQNIDIIVSFGQDVPRSTHILLTF